MGRDEAPDIGRFGWATAAPAKLVTLAARVGADPLKSSDAALQRLVMVLMAVGVLPMTILWSVVYLASGAPLAAVAPVVYSVVTPINTVLFAWTRNFRLYRFIQLLMTLVLPWLVTVSLGGQPAANGSWSFDVGANAVVFASAPAPGTVIDVGYKQLCPP